MDTVWLAVSDTLFDPVGILVTVVRDNESDGLRDTVVDGEWDNDKLSEVLRVTLLDPVAACDCCVRHDSDGERTT